MNFSSELIHAIDKLSLSHLGHAISDPILWIEMGNEIGAETPYRINASDRGMAESWSKDITHALTVYPSGFFHTASPLAALRKHSLHYSQILCAKAEHDQPRNRGKFFM